MQSLILNAEILISSPWVFHVGNRCQVFLYPRELDKGIFLYKSYINEKIKVSKRDSLNLSIDFDCRLQLKNNQWFLLVPVKTKVTTPYQRNTPSNWCALDPGVRSFQTVYSEESILQIKIKKDLIKKLQFKIDQFKSLRAKKLITKKRWKRKERRTFTRINNLIDDLHHKTSRLLTKTYDHIILPAFESQEISRKLKIKSVNRDLLQLKHYLFQQRLKAKCLLSGCILDICTEEFTSQTCGKCGCRSKVGKNDVFRCLSCGIYIDRDVNGARNIAIKRLKETLV